MVAALVLARTALGITEASLTRRLSIRGRGSAGLPYAVYQDTELVVIDKPAGIAAHPGPGHPDQTLVNGLLALCPDIQASAAKSAPASSAASTGIHPAG